MNVSLTQEVVEVPKVSRSLVAFEWGSFVIFVIEACQQDFEGAHRTVGQQRGSQASPTPKAQSRISIESSTHI